MEYPERTIDWTQMAPASAATPLTVRSMPPSSTGKIAPATMMPYRETDSSTLTKLFPVNNMPGSARERIKMTAASRINC